MVSPFLRINNLDKRFGELQVIRDVSLEVEKGEILALLGPSGSGKTTLLRLLAGFEAPDRGQIVVDGEVVTALPPARRRFGMVFQHYALFPHLSVGDNVAFGLEAQRYDHERRGPRVAEMLELVDLGGFEGRKVGEISGGQQQRVALARALAPEPRMLLLDEPLSNLDPTLRERTRRELKKAIRQVGITTVLVTHEQEEAFDLGDRVAVLHRGVLDQVGAPEELYETPATRFVASFVGRASALAGVLVAGGQPGAEAAVRLEGVDGRPWPGVLAEALPAGEAVELIVRPESLELVGLGTASSFSGRVVERRYAGPVTYFAVEVIPGCREVEVLAPSEAAAPGQRVAVAARSSGPAPRIFRPQAAGADTVEAS